MIDDIVAVDGGIDGGEAFQRFTGGLDEKAHKTEAYTVVGFLKQVLVLLAQRHHRLHVDLVEGGQHGGGLGGLQQALGDALAQAGHRHPFFDLVAGIHFHHRRGLRRRRLLGGGRRFGLGRRLGGGLGFGLGIATGVFEYVFLGYQTALTGGGDPGRIQAFFRRQFARRGTHLDVVVVTFGRAGIAVVSGRGLTWRRVALAGGCAALAGLIVAATAAGTGFKATQQFLALDGIALVLDDFTDGTIVRGHDFQYHFVGLDIDDQFVAGNRLARLFVPGGDGAVGDRLRKGWRFDFDGHRCSFTLLSVLSWGVWGVGIGFTVPARP